MDGDKKILGRSERCGKKCVVFNGEKYILRMFGDVEEENKEEKKEERRRRKESVTAL